MLYLSYGVFSLFIPFSQDHLFTGWSYLSVILLIASIRRLMVSQNWSGSSLSSRSVTLGIFISLIIP